jgi:hypothetical protein
MSHESLLSTVQDQYGAVARSNLSNESAAVRSVAQAFGYSPEDLASFERLLRNAGFEAVVVQGTGADLNAYAQAGGSDCCSSGPCCTPRKHDNGGFARTRRVGHCSQHVRCQRIRRERSGSRA